MKTTITPQEKIDYLYGQLSEERRLEIEKQLLENASLRREIRAMQAVSRELQLMDSEKAPAVDPDIIRKKATASRNRIFSPMMKAVAAVFVGFLVIGSASNLTIDYSEAGLAISMSLLPPPSPPIPPVPPHPGSQTTPLTPDVNAELIKQLQEQNALILAEILAQERTQQQEQLKALFSDYATMIENRRMIDLQLIQYELESIQLETASRIHNTDRVLYDLLEVLSYSN